MNGTIVGAHACIMVPTHRERLMSTCREAEFGDGMDPIDASPHAAINAAMECEISAGEHKGGGLICKTPSVDGGGLRWARTPLGSPSSCKATN